MVSSLTKTSGVSTNAINTCCSIAASLAVLYYGHQFFVKQRKLQPKKKLTKQNHDHQKGHVSQRGMKLSQSSPLPYLQSYFKAISNPCHHISNRQGYISLCVAENKLVTAYLMNILASSSYCDFAKIAFGNELNYYYNDTRGLEDVRKSVANFITKRFIQEVHPSSESSSSHHHEHLTSCTHAAASSTQIVLGSGAASILNFLFHCIANEDDIILIPAPYYAAFEHDMSCVAKCKPYPVHMQNPSNGPSFEDLEGAFQVLNLKKTHHGKIKGLLLTNPNNPLGTIYSPEVIKNCIDWARSRNIHVIVDEIYALSVHDRKNNKFQSVTKILQNKLENDVHFVWALSKDFGSSGFRVGVLYTHNKDILEAFGNLNMFSGVSHPIQAVVGKLLSDDECIDEILDTSSFLLQKSYDIVTRGLETMKIPYVKADAGIFVYCDFSSWLPTNSFEGEDKLARLFENYARIVMTPGNSQRDQKPGQFRICYAFVSPEVLSIAILRLQLLSQLFKKSGWKNIASTIDNVNLLNC